MGQTLSEPVTSKETTFCKNDSLIAGASSMQGWRMYMEDSHIVLLSLPDDPEASFFGVFDGHGGSRISSFAGRHLHKYITRQECYRSGDIKTAIELGFLDLDNEMKEDKQLRNDMSGTTAVIVLIREGVVYCGNAGDSRAIACVDGTVVPLSYDHKPNKNEESQRIKHAGGFIEHNRVNGSLALSRALGDYAFKQNINRTQQEQIISPFPEVAVNKITDKWEFILLACDGIWDVLSNEEAVHFVREHLLAGTEPDVICEELMNECLSSTNQASGIGCDNMTAVLITFLHNKS
ncbi:probable protein phosphatase 2C T23F11.1 [Rhodnius prolixus]|uniref:probable protein phosphatase 2C T23F11.1 n=1 Tax=Rhodnius prolixus TaxID=13249 RepID=UPI003D18F176